MFFAEIRFINYMPLPCVVTLVRLFTFHLRLRLLIFWLDFSITGHHWASVKLMFKSPDTSRDLIGSYSNFSPETVFFSTPSTKTWIINLSLSTGTFADQFKSFSVQAQPKFILLQVLLLVSFTPSKGRSRIFWGKKFPPSDNWSRSDRARPLAVLGVGAEGGRPLPLGSPGVLPPENF